MGRKIIIDITKPQRGDTLKMIMNTVLPPQVLRLGTSVIDHLTQGPRYRALTVPATAPDINRAMTWVLGNCSRMIFRNTVMGMAMIRPGIPQI